ncbi:MAG: glycosyltransferase family 4 protein [Fibromonadaceae bacterium]|nr:glycosyltransferase family 4 protein [Fibromonadaceae bacterium]
MKILILNYRDIKHPLAGGAEVHLHRIFGRLTELGHQVTLFTTSYENAPEHETLDGIEIIRCGSDAFFQFNVFRKVPSIVKSFQPNIIVEDLNKLPLFSPCVSKVPKLIQIHHLWKLSIFREAFFPVALAVWIGERLIPFVYRKCHFAAVSPSAKKELHGLGIANERISVIYNGTEAEYLEAEKIRDKSLYFLWLGRFRKYKGVWIAFDAFRAFAKKRPDVKLLFAGSGPEEAKMRAKTKKLGLEDRVEFLGMVGGEKKKELMGKALCLLQTSYKEGWGLTIIEAAACGTASIASNVSGLCDSVKDKETGLLFKAGSAASCAKKMEEIYSNAGIRVSMESAARAWASSFDWDNSARETLFLMQNIINQQ